MTTDELFGAKLIYELDPEKAAKEMIRRMCQKRQALGLDVPDHLKEVAATGEIKVRGDFRGKQNK